MTDNTIFSCDECEHKSSSRRGIAIHKSKAHLNEFQCSLCDTEYSSKGNLIRHMNTKHSKHKLFTQEQLMKEKELLQAKQETEILKAKQEAEILKVKQETEILKAKQETEILKIQNKVKDEMLKMQHENKEEVTSLMKEQLENKEEVTVFLKEQLEKAETRHPIVKVIKNVTHNNNISLITNSLEPITSEKLFRGVKNYSKEAALNNKLPTTTNDVINSLYNQNPRSFIANDKSRNLITWVDGDIKDPKDSIIKDSNGLTLAKKLNHAITEYKNEDPFAPLIEVIEHKRLTSNSEEDCMNVIQSTNVIQSFKNKDNNILSKIMTNSNSLIDLAPKTISTPHQLKESLTTLMHEFQKSFILEPFKVIIQSSDAVGQWIRNNLDFFGNVVVNEINMKVVINKEKETEMISFADLFASIRYVLKVVGNQDDETFDFNYLNDHILNKHKKYSPCKEEAIKNAQAFRDWIQTGNFEYQDKLYNMIQKNIRM